MNKLKMARSFLLKTFKKNWTFTLPLIILASIFTGLWSLTMMLKKNKRARQRMLKFNPKSVSEQWKFMADFILNEHQNVFRRSCQNINRGLYLELKDLSRWIEEEQKKVIKANSVSRKVQKVGPINTMRQSRMNILISKPKDQRIAAMEENVVGHKESEQIEFSKLLDMRKQRKGMRTQSSPQQSYPLFHLLCPNNSRKKRDLLENEQIIKNFVVMNNRRRFNLSRLSQNKNGDKDKDKLKLPLRFQRLIVKKDKSNVHHNHSHDNRDRLTERRRPHLRNSPKVNLARILLNNKIIQIPKTEVRCLSQKVTPRDMKIKSYDNRDLTTDDSLMRRSFENQFTPNISVFSFPYSEFKSPCNPVIKESQSSALHYINNSNVNKFKEFLIQRLMNNKSALSRDGSLAKNFNIPFKISESMLKKFNKLNKSSNSRSPKRQFRVTNRSLAIDDILEMKMS